MNAMKSGLSDDDNKSTSCFKIIIWTQPYPIDKSAANLKEVTDSENFLGLD